jgi:hypothetical protein
LDLDGVTRMEAAIGLGESCGSGLGIRRIHGSAPGLGGSGFACMAPGVIIGVAVGRG